MESHDRVISRSNVLQLQQITWDDQQHAGRAGFISVMKTHPRFSAISNLDLLLKYVTETSRGDLHEAARHYCSNANGGDVPMEPGRLWLHDQSKSVGGLRRSFVTLGNPTSAADSGKLQEVLLPSLSEVGPECRCIYAWRPNGEVIDALAATISPFEAPGLRNVLLDQVSSMPRIALSSYGLGDGAYLKDKTRVLSFSSAHLTLVDYAASSSSRHYTDIPVPERDGAYRKAFRKSYLSCTLCESDSGRSTLFCLDGADAVVSPWGNRCNLTESGRGAIGMSDTTTSDTNTPAYLNESNILVVFETDMAKVLQEWRQLCLTFMQNFTSEKEVMRDAVRSGASIDQISGDLDYLERFTNFLDEVSQPLCQMVLQWLDFNSGAEGKESLSDFSNGGDPACSLLLDNIQQTYHGLQSLHRSIEDMIKACRTLNQQLQRQVQIQQKQFRSQILQIHAHHLQIQSQELQSRNEHTQYQGQISMLLLETLRSLHRQNTEMNTVVQKTCRDSAVQSIIDTTSQVILVYLGMLAAGIAGEPSLARLLVLLTTTLIISLFVFKTPIYRPEVWHGRLVRARQCMTRL